VPIHSSQLIVGGDGNFIFVRGNAAESETQAKIDNEQFIHDIKQVITRGTLPCGLLETLE
jgi:hypothetical protein